MNPCQPVTGSVLILAAAKNRYTLSVWGQKKMVNAKIKSKMNHASYAIGPKRIVPVFAQIKPRYTRVCLLCLTFNCVLSFPSNQRPAIVPPYAPHANADLRGDPLQQHTYTRTLIKTCLHTSAEIHTA